MIKGLDYLAAKQADDGSWITGGGQAYPVAMTGLAGHGVPGPRQLADPGQVLARTSRGPSSSSSAAPRRPGLITGPTQDSGSRCTGTASP